MRKNVSQLSMVAMTLLFVSADAYAAGFWDEVKKNIVEWFSMAAGVGVVVSGGIWVLGDLFHVSWLEQTAQKHKKGLIAVAVLLAVSGICAPYIADGLKKLGNIFGA